MLYGNIHTTKVSTVAIAAPIYPNCMVSVMVRKAFSMIATALRSMIFPSASSPKNRAKHKHPYGQQKKVNLEDNNTVCIPSVKTPLTRFSGPQKEHHDRQNNRCGHQYGAKGPSFLLFSHHDRVRQSPG